MRAAPSFRALGSVPLDDRRAAFPYACGDGGGTGALGDTNHLRSSSLLIYEPGV